MKNQKFPLVISLLAVVIGLPSLFAQDRTVGLMFNTEDAFEGYTLFAPMSSTTTYLINNEGRLVHSWVSQYRPGLSAYLLENGNLLRTANFRQPGTPFNAGGQGGLVQEFDWDGNLVWEYEYSSSEYRQHHDIERLPNGNTLIIGWELKTSQEAIDAGRDPSLLGDDQLWPDHIIEVEPVGSSGGNIVWEWHAFDHLIQDYDSTKSNYGVVNEHPELIDINRANGAGGADWLHINAVDYNPELDQLVLSVHNSFQEIWVIDHSTTTEEAAGHTGGNSGKGGDLLYRWGNPTVYGAEGAQQLFAQHDAHWIEPGLSGAGNILIFNNGGQRPDGRYSSVDEIVPPVNSEGIYTYVDGVAYDPTRAVWSYVAPNPGDFFSSNISGAGRLPNGNTLICEGASGRFFEVTPSNEIVWEYINPVAMGAPIVQGDPIPTGQGGGPSNTVFRAYRYAPDYAGLAGRDLTPGAFIELYSSGVEDQVMRGDEFTMTILPNPIQKNGTLQFQLSHPSSVSIVLLNSLGEEVLEVVENQEMGVGSHSLPINVSALADGFYICRISANNVFNVEPIIILQ